MFRCWRGSLKWKFVICATAFHNGRIMYYYDPRSLASTANASAQTQNVVVDLADGKDVEFVTPYAAALNFTPFGESIALTAYRTTSGQTGSVFAAVVNPLRAGGVATTVKILVYLAGGDDYELAQPTFKQMMSATSRVFPFPAGATSMPAGAPLDGYSNDTPPGLAEELQLESDGSTFVQTSSLVSADAELVETRTKDITLWDQFSTLHFSERHLSVRAMIKRYVPVRRITMSTPDNNYDSCGLIVSSAPVIPGNVISTNSAVVTNEDWWCAFSWMMSCYAGYRGGFRVKLTHIGISLPKDFWATRFSLSVKPRDYWQSDGSALAPMLNEQSFNAGGVIANPGVSPTLEFAIPYESERTFRNHNFFTQYASFNTNNFMLGATLFEGTAAASQFNFRQFIAAADDMVLLYYIGPPVLFVTTIA